MGAITCLERAKTSAHTKHQLLRLDQHIRSGGDIHPPPVSGHSSQLDHHHLPAITTTITDGDIAR